MSDCPPRGLFKYWFLYARINYDQPGRQFGMEFTKFHLQYRDFICDDYNKEWLDEAKREALTEQETHPNRKPLIPYKEWYQCHLFKPHQLS